MIKLYVFYYIQFMNIIGFNEILFNSQQQKPMTSLWKIHQTIIYKWNMFVQIIFKRNITQHVYYNIVWYILFYGLWVVTCWLFLYHTCDYYSNKNIIFGVLSFPIIKLNKWYFKFTLISFYVFFVVVLWPFPTYVSSLDNTMRKHSHCYVIQHNIIFSVPIIMILKFQTSF